MKLVMVVVVLILALAFAGAGAMVDGGSGGSNVISRGAVCLVHAQNFNGLTYCAQYALTGVEQ